jgi:hypothetical protein
VRPSWSWSHGRWIYNYLCNQCLSPLKLWVRTLFIATCTRYNIYYTDISCLGGVFAKNTSLETKFSSPFGSGNFSSLDWYFPQIPLPNRLGKFSTRKIGSHVYTFLYAYTSILYVFLRFFEWILELFRQCIIVLFFILLLGYYTDISCLGGVSVLNNIRCN